MLMTNQIETRLKELNITLPQVSAPVANYLGYVRTGKLLIISGQLPMVDGTLICQGQLGKDVSIINAQVAAKQCAINILAQAKSACNGDLNKLGRLLRLGGFVNASVDFKDHAQVINGASDFVCEVLGEKGKHARAAVGCSSLPFGAAVEIEATFELED